MFTNRPPLLIADLKKDELDYVTCWLDHYHLGQNNKAAEIVGFLKEFKEQQDSGKSDFVLPPIPQ